MNLRDVEYHPLSFQQEVELERYRRIPYCAACCNEVRLYRLEGEIDTACLSLAVDDLVRRHAALRTTIGSRGPGHVQQVHAEPQDPFRESVSQADDIDSLAHVLLQQRHTMDDIVGGRPLFRAELHGVAGCVFLSITISHLVYDGLSYVIIVRDLAELYAARLAGRPAVLPPLGMSYGEFAELQRNSWREVRHFAVPFWASIVSGYTGTVHWPAPSPAQATSPQSARRNHEMALPADCLAQTLELARALRVSPFTVLLCATGVAVSRVTRQRDVLLGTQIANRNTPAVQQAVGFFSDIRITRLNALGVRSLDDLVVAVRDDWRAADRHRDASIDPVLEALGGPEFVKVDMGVDSNGNEDLTLPGVRVEEIPVAASDPYYRKLKVMWVNQKPGYVVNVIYQPSVVDQRAPVEITEQIAGILRIPGACF
ncbi:condensation domain-containing protein [Streptomyces sp. B1866]|uniref:condensation domain-containing protein n=1 Tax=Streptomyces sp. B1866 TaxID=3075431 RepID=UPI0028900AEC|nr:condensation domain-containing protein [Streptomyces sp. B1866]MDT3399270.1 condensation domain-containing protein [Streptomyces sp. B1866]